ncbi:hybrid sensor histidine kinase/response regulator [Microvirga sp. KLBC 81]|uniref:cell cycle histidine kinase CckA n=1 Tax=Microvirga sp. KLBC 81 TaxID=1862707 RepID=UPI000D519B00|nr:PAS domain-containing sensor histidine kinase [Microvirga sp. KLBC 81]PVE23669.1 hybrid sensor histidine kinase/response regulator [Microvirga sp. KLBC 81]
MAHQGDMPKGSTIDRSDRPGHFGWVLLLAAVLAGAVLSLRYLGSEQAQPLILGLLAFFAMAGVFFLFAWAIGVIQFAGQTVRNDITKLMADTAGEGLAVIDDDGRIIYANEAYLSFARSDGNEVRPVERLFMGAPEVSEAIYRLAQAAREHRTGTEEIRLSPSLDGAQEFGWYRVRVWPLPRSGSRKAALWSIADITHERERQENVFQELQHAIDYLDHAPAGFLSIDPNGSIIYLNATLATWLDYDLAQVGSGGLSLADIVPRNVVAMMTSFTGDPGTVRTETFDLDLRRRNGQFLPVRLYHRIAFGQDGRMGASRTLVINRSPGVEVDEGQRAAEVRFVRFFNNTPIAIATVNRAGRIVHANAPFSKLFGTLPRTGEGLGEGPSIFESFRESGPLEAALKVVVENRGDIAPLELQTAGENGSSVRVWVTPAGDTGADGEMAIIYALDTTDFRKVEEQLAQSQKMNAVGQLAGGVAHDFNNVLQAIIGYSDLLLANHRPTDPSFQDIMQIKQNANRAASLVRQLLAFSRRQTLRPEVLNLNDRLYDLSMLLKRLLGERVELDLSHGRDLWFVKADVNQFEQVVVNLAVNARDAMPNGGKLAIRTANVPAQEAARRSVSAMPPADYVLVEVSDTGAGMTPEVLDKIFEPFFTTKEVGKGTGLGLSTVFGIVKQSGGYIDVDSKPGQGTTFSIYLPRHIPDVQEAPEETKVDAPKKPAADMTGQGTILLVEDEDPVRAVNARALSARGYTVLEAASGVEALEIIQERGAPVDLVVSDVVMPEMDGPTLLGELRKLYPDLKVIFVSGYAEEAFRKNLPEGEDFNFLPKPFSLRQLVETVKQVMGR